MRYIYDNVMDIVTHKLLNEEPIAAKRLFLKELDILRQVNDCLSELGLGFAET